MRTAAIITTDCIIGGYFLMAFLRLDLDTWMMLSNIMQGIFCVGLLMLTKGRRVG